MIEVPVRKLCLVGKGKKFHIKGVSRNRIDFTLCGYAWNYSIAGAGLTEVPEEALCRDCLKRFRVPAPTE